VIALVGAVREELYGIRRRLSVRAVNGQGRWRLIEGVYRQREVVLLQTGMGKLNAEEAVRSLLAHYPVSVLVSLGFAGALAAELGVGDLVLCRELAGEEGNACASDSSLLHLAQKAAEVASLRLHTVRGATSGKLVTEPEAKRVLDAETRAQAVDMESYWIAKLAAERGVRFVAVRAISDTLKQHLPPLEKLLNQGHMRMARYFLTHPAQLLRLYLQARAAQRSLTRLCAALLPLLDEELHDIQTTCTT
jgi:adenosylhomocysteine nucleosidase